MQRHWVQVVQFFAPVPNRRNEVRGLEDREVFGDGLAAYGKVFAEIA